MAIGDDAEAYGFELVPMTGEEGRVYYGAQEINRTRDYIAELGVIVPRSEGAFRTASGITSGTAAPSGGVDGDVYFQIIG